MLNKQFGGINKMLKFKPINLSSACLTFLSFTLLASSAFGYDDTRVSYLDSVSSSYLYTNQNNENGTNFSDSGIETTLRLDASTPITKSKAVINLSLRDSDIRQVLRMLADKAGLNIIFDQSIEGKLTLDLNNININDAFLAIFKSSQLTYTLEGNTLTVMTLEAAKDLGYARKNMTVLPIKYVNANSVAEFLNENLFKSNIFGLSHRAIVTSNPATNQIVVFGSTEDVTAIKRVLPVLDVKPQVNTFTVNHTTPKEMAQLICDTFFSLKKSSEELQDDSDDDDEKITLGGGKLACRDNYGVDTEVASNSDTASAATNPGDASLKAFSVAPLTVSYFPSLGKISLLGGSYEQVQTIKDFIKEHDKKQLMAYIELSVIELNEAGSKDFNNAWNLWTPFISLGFGASGFNVGSESNPFFVWGKKYTDQRQEGTVTGPDLSDIPYYFRGSSSRALLYTLNYIIENSNGRTLTNPKIMVTNGKKSTIDMTSDYVKSVTSQVLDSSNGMVNGTQKTYNIGDDEGLLIEVLPFISPDGYVSLNITPEFSTIKTQAQEYTLLQRRDLSLKNIRIKDGETLVLAGLIKENESQKAVKMPILSDLPFIGSFFRQSQNKKTREELVIVVTPHIIKDRNDDKNVYDL